MLIGGEKSKSISLSEKKLKVLYLHLCKWVVLRIGVPRGGDHVRDCITHLLSIKNSNVDDFHVSITINI